MQAGGNTFQIGQPLVGSVARAVPAFVTSQSNALASITNTSIWAQSSFSLVSTSPFSLIQTAPFSIASARFYDFGATAGLIALILFLAGCGSSSPSHGNQQPDAPDGSAGAGGSGGAGGTGGTGGQGGAGGTGLDAALPDAHGPNAAKDAGPDARSDGAGIDAERDAVPPADAQPDINRFPKDAAPDTGADVPPDAVLPETGVDAGPEVGAPDAGLEADAPPPADAAPDAPHNKEDAADAADAMITENQDRDGVLNVSDNCPDTANPLQGDANHNGIGDACDRAGINEDFVTFLFLQGGCQATHLQMVSDGNNEKLYGVCDFPQNIMFACAAGAAPVGGEATCEQVSSFSSNFEDSGGINHELHPFTFAQSGAALNQPWLTVAQKSDLGLSHLAMLNPNNANVAQRLMNELAVQTLVIHSGGGDIVIQPDDFVGMVPSVVLDRVYLSLKSGEVSYVASFEYDNSGELQLNQPQVPLGTRKKNILTSARVNADTFVTVHRGNAEETPSLVTFHEHDNRIDRASTYELAGYQLQDSRNVVVSEDGRYVYLVTSDEQHLVKVDLNSNPAQPATQLIDLSANLQGHVQQIARRGNTITLTDDQGQIAFVDTASSEVTCSYELGATAAALTVDGAGMVYLATPESRIISIQQQSVCGR